MSRGRFPVNSYSIPTRTKSIRTQVNGRSSQLKNSRTAVPAGNVFKSNDRNTETLTLRNAEGSDLVRVGIAYDLSLISI